jgi:hypothetical protein
MTAAASLAGNHTGFVRNADDRFGVYNVAHALQAGSVPIGALKDGGR